MKPKLSIGKILILLVIGWLFAWCGLYYDKLILTMGIFVLFLASILFSILKRD